MECRDNEILIQLIFCDVMRFIKADRLSDELYSKYGMD